MSWERVMQCVCFDCSSLADSGIFSWSHLKLFISDTFSAFGFYGEATVFFLFLWQEYLLCLVSDVFNMSWRYLCLLNKVQNINSITWVSYTDLLWWYIPNIFCKRYFKVLGFYLSVNSCFTYVSSNRHTVKRF